MSTTVQHNNLLERNWSLGIWWGWHSFSSTKNNDTFTSNQIYLSLVYINELHLKHKMKYNFRISANFSLFCTNVSYGFSPKIQNEMLQQKGLAIKFSILQLNGSFFGLPVYIMDEWRLSNIFHNFIYHYPNNHTLCKYNVK